VTTPGIVASVVGVLALAELAAIVVLGLRLGRSRRALVELEARVRETRPGGAVATTERLVKAVVQGAARVREQGVAGTLSSSLADLAEWAKQDRARIVRVAAPDGTVTFFFTDIENSTALNEELGDAQWVRTLDAHNRLVHRHVDAHGGSVVKTIGDGVMAVFAEPGPAVLAAVEIQESLQGGPQRRLRRATLKVRIGIHVGPAVARGGDYFGRNVALCARIADHAAGGETLVSDDVYRAVGDGADTTFVPRGEVTFKGIAGPTSVLAVARRTA
jgi:adenylate cyclase